MNTISHVPPGFRFHPTDEELVNYYLRKKINSRRIELDIIRDIDLYKIEPWDLQEMCRIGSEDQTEWYFFSHKDKKYPTGTRTNRATEAGFWKATGRDKSIYSKQELIGMRKTLVFYKGRAPNGQKSDWIMHEYRLETYENGTTTQQEEGWVICRVFKKKTTTIRRINKVELNNSWYDDQHQNSQYNIQLPQQYASASSISAYVLDQSLAVDQVTTDWRVLDKFVASQLSQEDLPKQHQSDHFLIKQQDAKLDNPSPSIGLSNSVMEMTSP